MNAVVFWHAVGLYALIACSSFFICAVGALVIMAIVRSQALLGSALLIGAVWLICRF
jgi:hypothetical protein